MKNLTHRVIVFLTVLIATGGVSWGIPLEYGTPNTFHGVGRGETAGFSGAAPGTQGHHYNYRGSVPSLDTSGVSGLGPLVVNLPQHAPSGTLRAPFGMVFESAGLSTPPRSFGQEVTTVIGGLWPVAVHAGANGGTADNGLAPGSTAGDGVPDQIAPLNVPGYTIASYFVTYGPGSHAGGAAAFDSEMPAPPVFEIYDDVPPGGDLYLGATTTLIEPHMDFDGDGPSLTPADPSQFVNTTDGGVADNQIGKATDGRLFAAGYLDTATAVVTFFSPTTVGSGGNTANGGYTYSIHFSAKGHVNAGYIAPGLVPLQNGTTAYGDSVDITMAASLYGQAWPTLGNGSTGFVGMDGLDPSSAFDIWTALLSNGGNAAFTILPTAAMPEPGTAALLACAVAGIAALRRRTKRRAA